MKEIPILFSTPMVLALLDGRKTMTRRTRGLEVINERAWAYEYSNDDKAVLLGDDNQRKKVIFRNYYPQEIDLLFKTATCPYGNQGDLLWVRENFQPLGWTDSDDSEFIIKYKADASERRGYFEDTEREEKYIKWVFDEMEKKHIKLNNDGSWKGKKCPLKNRPAIHMFKDFSRIWLQVKSIRVERLNRISMDDARAEGIDIIELVDGFTPGYKDYLNPKGFFLFPHHSFFSLWQSINGAESLDANHFVWVVEFEVLSTTGKAAALAKMERGVTA
ncbi:hypothetical protein BDE36_1791 [Arcticibacter tournemirensis]|uniref:Uncharacterized protein n=1 Tax=Arcticibacter tournemirensis TaxID=699437 RepID=A0A5M9HBS7_9SPHI|nr:hypothetical protein [Arcticibacter tournemirensis]KAA8483745.1 hypothetical protein F1649_07605 [Arcticibacter tournemirensis]TQM50056.1 hypothetical protein BDE36_1791 [Arcticibacter tournemirensis]